MNKLGKAGIIGAGIVLAGLTYKGIKKARIAVRDKENNFMGFDWDRVLNYSADPIDFFKQLGREIDAAWQRVYKGYDDRMFWNFDDHLDRHIINCLRFLIKHRHGSPVLDGWTEEDCHDKWTLELKKMLYYFMQSQEEYCSEVNEYDELVDFESYFVPSECGHFSTMHYKDTSPEAEEIRDKYYQRSKEIDAYRDENHKKGLEMLCMHYRRLWD